MRVINTGDHLFSTIVFDARSQVKPDTIQRYAIGQVDQGNSLRYASGSYPQISKRFPEDQATWFSIPGLAKFGSNGAKIEKAFAERSRLLWFLFICAGRNREALRLSLKKAPC